MQAHLELPLMKRKKIADFFTSGLGLLILGFVLTTVCGGLVNWMYARSSWQRDKQFELLKVDLAKHDELLTDFTKVIGARVFRLQRVVWHMDPPVTPAPEAWDIKKDDDQKDDDQKLKKALGYIL
jgi:hypothetical protein